MEPGLKLSDFTYELPPDLIAQHPLEQRDKARLMVLGRSGGRLEHRQFADIEQLLRPGDLLIANNTRVIPAKFFCRRGTGGRIEGLFLREIQPGRWEVMLKNAGRCGINERLELEGGQAAVMPAENLGLGRWLVNVEPALPAVELLEQAGTVPLPPYIRRSGRSCPADKDAYQTVYASTPGAVAAPTAGLHFTSQLLERLGKKGIERAFVTLHVGMGTFLPVKVENLREHVMHQEWYSLAADTAERINAARSEGRRVIAVGTTSVRVLETVYASQRPSAGQAVSSESGWTKLFLYPPARFGLTDAMITNFHLPQSTLLMLVSAFCCPGSTDGIATLLGAYRQAVAQKYRFFSYGDAMFIE